MKQYAFLLIAVLNSVFGNSQITEIDSGMVVKSINLLKDDIELVAGANMTIMTSGNKIIISSLKSGTAATNFWKENGNHISNINNGNIGIGTTNPDSRLHVGGDIHLEEPGGIFFNRGPSDPNYYLKPYSAPNEWGMRLNGFSGVRLSTGQGDILNVFQHNVGIGTTSPGAKLHVSGGTVLLDNTQYLQNFDETGSIRDVVGTLSDGTVEMKGFHGTPMIRGVNGNTYIFGSGGSGSGTLGLTIANNGNVGIGTTSPATALDVQGSVKAQEAHVEGSTYLGESAPGIKMKKITGTYTYRDPIKDFLTPFDSPTIIKLPLGVSLDKILSVNVLINHKFPPSYGVKGLEYNYWLRDSSSDKAVKEPEIWITERASLLDGAPITILITYEE